MRNIAYGSMMMSNVPLLRSIGARNAVLAFGLLLLFGIAISLSDRFSERRAVLTEHDRLSNLARLTASGYQRQVDKFRLVATTLSSDPDVARLLDVRNQEAATRLNQRLANLSATLDASVIYLINDEGTTIASSNWRQADSFLGENYGFRDYFKRAMASGAWEQFALGTRSGVPGLFVARRVITGAGARGVIVVKIRFDRLEAEWARSAGIAFVSNGQGVILVSSRPEWRFQTIRQLGDAEQQRLRAQVEFGSRPLVENALYTKRAIIDQPADFTAGVTHIEAQAPLPNGWQVHVVTALADSLSAARTFGRLIILVAAGFIATLITTYVLRRRAVVARAQRENAARISDLKDRLMQSNKLSMLGQIAAGVGHEINQPLMAIGIRAQTAAKLVAAGRSEEAAVAVNEIGALATRIGAITGELRRFARRADGRTGAVSLAAVLSGMQLLLGDRLRSTGTSLIVDPAATAISVIAEQGKLEQVFVNLVQNAMDAMGDGGEIMITADPEGDQLLIRIADSGPGIAPDIVAKLFQPFTSSKHDGVGLGLVICRDIINEFGGELRLEPSERGASFLIMLKAAQ